MRLLNPPPPPETTAVDRLCPVVPPVGIVHVAVGRSISKTLALLQWTFRQFDCKEVGLIHVHQPSSTIPTLVGRLPANEANDKLVAEYRDLERKEMEKILQNYESICHKAQVQPKIMTTEAGHIQKGIVDLITRYGICKLVTGTASSNCFKVKGNSSKVTYIVRNTPLFCEIWFVSNGRHLWTREARERIWSSLLDNNSSNSTCNFDYLNLNPFNTPQIQRCISSNVSESDNAEVAVSATDSNSCFTSQIQTTSRSQTCNIGKTSCLTLVSEKEASRLCLKDPEMFRDQLQELGKEIETLKKEASNELAKRKNLELNIAEALNRVKTVEAASAEEAKIRVQLQGVLQRLAVQRKELACEKDHIMTELQNAKTSIALLDQHAKVKAYSCVEAAGELEIIQSYIRTLLLERSKPQEQRKKIIPYSEIWRCCNNLHGITDNTVDLKELSAFDIETATCGFSESFKLGQEGYGCIYKGEILNRTVVLKKLHLHYVQEQNEFQREIHVLSKLRHPHLVNLVGYCPELLSLVYEYLPNGNLHYHLFSRTASAPLTWIVRTKIIADVSSALQFLHASKPERIVHGNLKPNNIFLDSDLNCKIGDFSIFHLVPENTGKYLFHHNIDLEGTCAYTDPEYQRTGVLTPKSDVYSFGVIILQLLTGRHPLGLPSEVRRAVLSGTLPLILDASAGEWPNDVASKLAEIGLQCSEMNSRNRPDLTPGVVRELEQLYMIEQRPVPPLFLCPILQEIMHDPQVAADGYTYEESAFRGWLKNGRGTSPMTNLELDNLSLTPNHALRFAIQDWLCEPCQP